MPIIDEFPDPDRKFKIYYRFEYKREVDGGDVWENEDFYLDHLPTENKIDREIEKKLKDKADKEIKDLEDAFNLPDVSDE